MQEISQATLDMMLNRYPRLSQVKAYEGKWSYDVGVVLKGMQEAYELTEDSVYLDYLQACMDDYIAEDGTIRYYRADEKNIDYLNNGKILVYLFQKTGEEKYRLAADRLFHQVQTMPRTKEGGFWHKEIYPHQMWLDGLYMGAPFYTAYSKAFRQGQDYQDILHQFDLCQTHLLDSETGLLYHAWDSERVQPWANPETGLSQHFWGRAMGWYSLALVDTIALLPEDLEGRERLVTYLNSLLKALLVFRHPQAKVWYQVVDQGNRHGNYLEASASSMYVAAALKAAKLGLIEEEVKDAYLDSFEGLLEEFVLYTKEGWVNLIRNCEVAGLGGADKRDGSFTYYVSEPIVTNDFKGLGAFIQACVAWEELGAKG